MDSALLNWVPLREPALTLSWTGSASHQHVPPAVQGQVVGPGKAAVTVRTLEWLHSRVFAVMPRQFVRTGKLPGAAFPGALVGLLSWKKQRNTGLGAPSLLRNNPASTTCWETVFNRGSAGASLSGSLTILLVGLWLERGRVSISSLLL